MKVAYVLSYKHPDYVRTRFILQSLDKLPGVEVFKAVNSHRGFLRYFQTAFKLVCLRVAKRPDVYILGFRGAETYWLVRLLTWRKPLVYDEFINPYLWSIEEHKKFKPSGMFERLIRRYTGYTLKSADLVLSDTDAHAGYSADNFDVDRSKFLVLYVGTDEEIFQKTAKTAKKSDADKSFNVFFYGNFLPLHGISQIVRAAEIVKEYTDIKLTIIGGTQRPKNMNEFLDRIKELKLKNIEHKPWVEYEKLPIYIEKADLCLGGPFGDTPQARKVITGKTYQFLALGKPVIIGKIDEATELRDEENCLLINQGSSGELAEKIIWAYKNRAKLAKIGAKGKILYENVFSQKAQLHKLEKALKDLAG